MAKDVALVRNIKWVSVDKDNMEFTARVTCFSRDALKRILDAIDPPAPACKHNGRFARVPGHLLRMRCLNCGEERDLPAFKTLRFPQAFIQGTPA